MFCTKIVRDSKSKSINHIDFLVSAVFGGYIHCGDNYNYVVDGDNDDNDGDGDDEDDDDDKNDDDYNDDNEEEGVGQSVLLMIQRANTCQQH